MNLLKKLFQKPAPKTGVYLVALVNQVVISHTGGALTITPELARRLAAELPAMATIAEQQFKFQQEAEVTA